MNIKIKSHNPWIKNPLWDSCFILSPAFVSLILGYLLSRNVSAILTAATYLWALRILFDNSHVFSTFWRFVDSKNDQEHFGKKTLVIFVLCLIGVTILDTQSLLYKIRILTYCTIYHFIRQNYGFLMIYAHKDYRQTKTSRAFDKTIIYATGFIPIIIWHMKSPKSFSWNLPGEFFVIPNIDFSHSLLILYIAMLIAWLFKECYYFFNFKYINLPKVIFFLGTFLVWTLAIVIENNEILFHTSILISHSVPYFALVWLHRSTNLKMNASSNIKKWIHIFGFVSLPIFLSYSTSIRENLTSQDINFFTRILFIIVPAFSFTHIFADSYLWRIKKGSPQARNRFIS